MVYIKVSYESLEKRLGSLKQRGVIFEEGQTLRDIYEQRIPLYEKYADITVDSDNESDVSQMAARIAELFEND